MFDLVTIGHTARDEFEGDPEWRIGGTATYAAAAAACLGDRVALLTRVGPNERERLAKRCREVGIELHALESAVTTTFSFRYVDGRRRLRLKARAKGIGADAIPPALRQTRAVVLASIAHEIEPSVFSVFAGVPRVLAAQGYLRSWDAVASFAVEGVGTAALASREQVQARMRSHSPSVSSRSTSDGMPPGRTIP